MSTYSKDIIWIFIVILISFRNQQANPEVVLGKLFWVDLPNLMRNFLIQST